MVYFVWPRNDSNLFIGFSCMIDQSSDCVMVACQRDIRKSCITPKSFKLFAQNFDSSISIMY